MGDNKYPSTVTEAYNLLLRYRNHHYARASGGGGGGVEGVTLNTVEQSADKNGGEKGTGNPRGRNAHKRCYACGKYGHISYDCPEEAKGEEKHSTNTTVEDERGGGPPSQVNVDDNGGGDEKSAASSLPGSIGAGKKYDPITGRVLTTIFQEDSMEDDWEEFTFVTGAGGLQKSWLLLDNQSTCHVFRDKSRLSGVHVPRRKGVIKSNGGTNKVTEKGSFGPIEDVWHDPASLANILSLGKLQETHKITFDSAGENKFIVHCEDGSMLQFRMSAEGLYYYDMDEDASYLALVTKEHKLTTVKGNMEGYTPREVQRAKVARDAMALMGFPSECDMIRMVKSGMVSNCPVSVSDIRAARDIFGPDVPSLKGKTVRHRSPRVELEFVEVPEDIYKRNRSVILAIDVMKVNGLAFLVTVSLKIDLVTVEFMPSMTIPKLTAGVERAIRVYQNKGLQVATSMVDGQFDAMRGLLGSIDLNVTAAQEHVPVIERKIRVIKERFRAVRSTLPFRHLPSRVIIEAVTYCVLWMNAHPSKNGVSDVFSPREIMTNTRLDYAKHCKVLFGSYCQVYQENQPSNTDVERTVDALCLGPTGNAQGGYKFFCLSTRKKIVRNQYTALPMPRAIIEQVERCAEQENRVFDGEDWTVVPGGVDQRDNWATCREELAPTQAPLPPAPIPVLQMDVDVGQQASVSELGGQSDLESGHADYSDSEGDVSQGVETFNNEIADEDEWVPEEEAEPEHSVSRGTASEDGREGDADETTTDRPPPVVPYNLRPRRERNYDHRFGFLTIGGASAGVQSTGVQSAGVQTAGVSGRAGVRESLTYGYTHALRHIQRQQVLFHYVNYLEEVGIDDDVELDSVMPRVAHRVMVQLSLKQGLREFGDRGRDAVSAELHQVHMKQTFRPSHWKELSKEQRDKVLESLIFLEEKRSGKIKGRICADGRKQRQWTPKEDAASPTIMTDSILLTTAMDAAEHREVAVIDLPGAFLFADMDEVVHMVMRGELAELMAATAPEIYRPFVIYGRNSEAMLYVTLQKALYGCLKSALLFYRKLLQDLKSIGFKLNPYDPCVANKTIRGRQFTIGWHVDDLKLSHWDGAVVDGVVDWFKEKYGNVKISRGPVHDFLGMKLDFSHPGRAKITMYDFLKRTINDFPEEVRGQAATPAGDHLFDVRAESERKLLSEEWAQAFHHAVAQLLFVMIRCRRDLFTAVSFLTTRVKAPDEDDWGKLRRVLRYVRNTLYLPLVLEVDDVGVIKWWVDVSFAVHPDFRSHSGGAMSMGKGVILAGSKKQKLNTKSTAESEIVGVDDFSGQILWTNYFMEAQGYRVIETVVYQDNQSAILLEVNGKQSSSKRTRHMNIKYFFIKDRVDSGEITIRYCPTEDMVADYFTKPLQGSQFRKLRGLIMNVDPSIPDCTWSKERSVKPANSHGPQECVGNRGTFPIVRRVSWDRVMGAGAA